MSEMDPKESRPPLESAYAGPESGPAAAVGEHPAEQTAHEAADKARQEAARLKDKMQGRAREIAEHRKSDAADRLASIGQALHHAADKLKQDEQERQYAEYADKAGESLESVSKSLREHDVHELTSRLTEYARRRPEVFLGGAFLCGLALARFLKSSPPAAKPAGPGGQEV